MERLFHAACALVMLLSLIAFVHGDKRERDIQDPRGDLFAFLTAQGGKLGEPLMLPGGDAIVPLAMPACKEAGQLLYLPTIHRISEPAKSLWDGATDAVFVHDRAEVASLAPLRIIPRWLVRRLAVNFQIIREDPWISIAFALLPPKGCTWPKLDWSKVSERD